MSFATRTMRARSRRRSLQAVPGAESLEDRRVLSGFNAPALIQPVVSPAGVFLVEVGGPGYVSIQPAPNGAVNVRAYGTTTSSTITVEQVRTRPHVPNGLLSIHDLSVRSGELGNIVAPQAQITGRVSPLSGGVTLLELGALMPKAQVDIAGDVGSLSIGSINIGPTGRFTISGNLDSLAQLADSTSTTLSVDQTAPMSIGSITIDGGIFSIGMDSLSSISIDGNLDLNHDGVLSIGRDEDGTFSVNGSIILDTGGQLRIGRNLSDLTVTGNVIVNPTGSGIVVHGALAGLAVSGYFQGQGGLSAPSLIDLGVGLNLSNLTITGGISGQGGLVNANVTAGGTASNVAETYGSYNSSVQSNTAMPN